MLNILLLIHQLVRFGVVFIFLAVADNAAREHSWTRKLSCKHVFCSFRCIPRAGIAESYGNSDFLRNRQAVFQRAAPFYICTGWGGAHSSPCSPTLVTASLYYCDLPSRCAVVSHRRLCYRPSHLRRAPPLPPGLCPVPAAPARRDRSSHEDTGCRCAHARLLEGGEASW